MSKTEFASADSPFHELLGIELVEWRDGFARIVCDLRAAHANRSGIAHGGLILSMMDQAAAFAGLWCGQPGHLRKAVTVDLDCRFTGQVKEGRIIAEGRMMSRGRNIFFARTEVFDAEGRLVAYGASTHKWRKGSETTDGVPADQA